MTDNQAQAIFRAAYENRYTWDENFPGYTADLKIQQGEEVYTARVRVNSDLSFEVSDLADEQVRESVNQRMGDIITHRQRSSFEQAHGKNEFSLGETDDTGAVKILVSGKAMGSHYKVRDREICHVNRVVGPMTFSIDTEDSQDTGEGYISTRYSAEFRNSKDNELRGQSDFEETYDKFGDYYLPVRQLIHSVDKEGNKTTTVFAFSNIKLLTPAAV